MTWDDSRLAAPDLGYFLWIWGLLVGDMVLSLQITYTTCGYNIIGMEVTAGLQSQVRVYTCSHLT